MLCPPSHCHLRAVPGGELARDAVQGADAGEIVADGGHDGRLASADGGVQAGDRRFFELEGNGVDVHDGLARSGALLTAMDVLGVRVTVARG